MVSAAYGRSAKKTQLLMAEDVRTAISLCTGYSLPCATHQAFLSHSIGLYTALLGTPGRQDIEAHLYRYHRFKTCAGSQE